MLAAFVVAIALATAPVFPALQARDLAGKDRSSADLRGSPAAIVLAIGRGSSSGMRPWQEFMAEVTGGKLRVIECPVFYRSNLWMRPMVEAILARRRPKERWADVWTTGDGDRLARDLGLKNSGGDVAVVLLDAQGQVVQIVHGGLTPENKKAAQEAWERLRQP